MINAGIVGSTGYAGSELVRLLKNHKDINIKVMTSRTYADENYGDVFENFRGVSDVCINENIEEMADQCDVIFLALPHGLASKKINKALLDKTSIIDLGADYRLKNIATYEEWYKTKHESVDLIDEAVYGLCEINRKDIAEAKLVANPGCYTTCSILALYPLVKERLIDLSSIIIDAKSGMTGAGRGVGLTKLFCETNESVKAYSLFSHRHAPEIEEQLSYGANKEVSVLFTPHIVPMNRGILATCYCDLNESAEYEDIKKIYEKYYGDEYFIRITKEGILPETKWVIGSNFTDIGFAIKNNKIIVVSALDNLIKGAAGQAVQNMNIMYGIDEKIGLENYPIFPA